MYRSGFERTLAAQLNNRGIVFGYETLKLPFVLQRTYIPDFVLNDKFVIEAKGVLDADDRQKLLAVKAQHPDLDLRLVFMNADNRLSKTSKTTYGQWADKNRIPYSSGKIPEEWLVTQDT